MAKTYGQFHIYIHAINCSLSKDVDLYLRQQQVCLQIE